MKILVDVQGRICLPAKVRRDLGIESGNYVEVNFDSNLSSIVISKPKAPASALVSLTATFPVSSGRLVCIPKQESTWMLFFSI